MLLLCKKLVEKEGVILAGRPKGSNKPKESLITAAKRQEDISTKPDVSSISKEESNEILVKKPYKCVMCGTRYAKQQNNFPYSQSPFFKGNNSYLPICNNCINSATDQYQAILGNQDDAIRRMCLHWDIYLSDSILSSSKKIDAKRSRIKEYIRQCNLTQNAGKTYDDYMNKKKGNTILSESEIEDMEESDAKKLQRNIAKWGLGYNEQEFDLLNSHYKILKAQIETEDPVQESLVKDLCDMQVMKLRARQDKDIDRYDKISKLYQNTLATANLKPTGSTGLDENDPNATWGCFNRDIEKYTPAEYFKDKSVFKDADGLGDYVNRHMFRPMKNWILGTKDKDKEYSLSDEEEE